MEPFWANQHDKNRLCLVNYFFQNEAILIRNSFLSSKHILRTFHGDVGGDGGPQGDGGYGLGDEVGHVEGLGLVWGPYRDSMGII